MNVAQVSAGELKQRLEQGDSLVVLDVREDDERAFCSIPLPPTATDLHIPMGQIVARFEELRAIAGPMVVYCHHGVRSMTVATWLAGRGISAVHNLHGGIDAWSVAVDPGVRRY